MANEIPHIFDRGLRARRRGHAARDFGSFAFLAERAAKELGERLDEMPAFAQGAAFGARAPEASKVGDWVRCDSAAAFLAPPRSVVAHEDLLPFAPHVLDLYASVLTLHAANDLPGALAQIRRALKPDGLFVAAMFGGETLKELRQAFAEAEIECDGGLSPRVFPFADVRDMGALLQRAGFAQPIVDGDTVTVHYAHPLNLLADLRGMAETNVLVERRRTPLKPGTLERMYEIYVQKFAGPDGRVRATFQILYLSGRARAEAQQQPLGPDAARMRLG